MARLFAVIGLALLALAQPSVAADPVFPKLTGRVVDNAHLLTPSQVVDLTSKSEALEAQSGAQLVVATVPSLDGLEPFDYGYKLIRHWQLGQKDKDDGVLLLVAPKEREVFIATGYGARTRLTDAMAGVIVRNAIIPAFKKNPPDYGAGIAAGVDQIVTQMKLPEAEAAKRAGEAETQSRATEEGDGGIFWIFVAIFIFMFFIRPMFSSRGGRRRYRRGAGPVVIWGPGWGGGGGDFGGGGGFGGGGFGGGGFGGFSGGGGSAGGGGAGGSW